MVALRVGHARERTVTSRAEAAAATGQRRARVRDAGPRSRAVRPSHRAGAATVAATARAAASACDAANATRRRGPRARAHRRGGVHGPTAVRRVDRPERVAARRSASPSSARSSSGVGHRAPAGEALADVGGGAPSTGARPSSSGTPSAAAGRRRARRAGAAARAPRARSGSRAAGVAGQRDLADRPQVEVERLQQVRRTPPGGAAASSCSSRSCADGRVPRSGPRRSAPRGAAARARRRRRPPGSARPRGPCGARRSCSWSAAVEKKPPCSASAKRSIIASASARASANQRGSKVAS